MAHRKPPTMVTASIKQALRDRYDGRPGDEFGPLFSGKIVCSCPFCDTIMAISNPTTSRFSCLRCTHKGGRGWRQLAAQLGIDAPHGRS